MEDGKKKKEQNLLMLYISLGPIGKKLMILFQPEIEIK